MATTLRRQLERAEWVIYPKNARRVACAWHALAELYPRVPVDPADIFAGSCGECGGDMDFNMEGCTTRERELSAEFYFRGYTLDTLTTSRRACAVMLWLCRRGRVIKAAPGEVYKRALIEEHGRRMGAKWSAHFEGMSDEAFNAVCDVLALDAESDGAEPSDAELEAIIWPPA